MEIGPTQVVFLVRILDFVLAKRYPRYDKSKATREIRVVKIVAYIVKSCDFWKRRCSKMFLIVLCASSTESPAHSIVSQSRGSDNF